MAERDLEFTAGVVFDTGALTAEMRRLTALMEQSGAALNLQGPIEAAGAAARRAAQDFRAVDLSLVNITKSAATVGQQYIAQQAALKKVETAIRTISQLPITTQKQYDALLALEALQARLQALTKNSRDLDLNTPQKLAQAMAGVTTQMARFEAELKGVAQAQAQVATLGEAMRVALSSRIPLDPSYIATLTQLRETIGQVGPLGRAAFGELQLRIASVERELGAATQMELNFNAALERNQRESMRVAAAYDIIGKSLQAQDRIAEAAGIRQERRLQEIIRLQTRVAALPVTSASTAISGQLAGMQGPGQNPVLIAELRTRILQLETANNLAAASAKKLAADIDASGNAAKRNVGSFAQLERAISSLGSRIQRQTEFILAAAASYAAFNTLSAVVTHVVALDEAMHRISATIDDQEDKARLLPRTYALIQQGMTQFGQSTEDAGKLVLELTRSLGDLTQINAAFLPALALTVRGEVNMADATKVLIGSVNAFGAELIGATDPLEAYGLAADKIIRASNLSVGSIGTFSVALTNLAGRASVTNTTFSETLAALSLVQDSLGRAGQSGTGLARVFEGLLLHANQLADIFDIAFDPARAVNPIDLLTKTFAKLREEIKLTGGVSSETEAKIQKIIGTEQGTRIIELLVKDWEKFPARLKAISDSSGQHLRELKEHNEQLGVSFTNLTNSALVAFDTILIAFAKLGGASGGTPGQFTTLAQAFNIIAAGAIQFGKDIDRAAEGIKQFVIAIANMRPPPSWLSQLVGAPAGTPAASALDKVATDLDKVGKALSFLPEPPDWLMRMLGLTASVAGGFLLLGPVGAAIGLLGYQVSQYAIDAQAAQEAADKLTKSANAAARAMGIQAGHDPAAIGDAAAQAEADVERNRVRMLKERLALLKDLETKSANEIAQRSGELGIIQQIAAARANAAKSEKDYQEARAKYADDQKLSYLGEKDAAAAGEKIAQLKKKSVTDQIELNALQQTYAKNQRDNDKEAVANTEKRAEVLARLTKEYQKATLSPSVPFLDLSLEQADEDIKTKIAAIAKGMGGIFHSEFAIKVEGLITQTVIAELTSKQQAIFDALVTPYRDASEAAVTEIDKIIERAEYLARQPSLSPEARAEAIGTPARAVDIKLGVDVAERQLKSLTAAFNKFGEEAVAATFAGSKGFDSFSDMVVQADIDTLTFGKRGLREMINGFLRLRQTTQEVDLQTIRNEIAATAKAIDDLGEIGGDPARIAANAVAVNVWKKSLNDLELSAEGAERALAAMLVTSAKQLITKDNVVTLTAQLEVLKRTNDGIVASFGQTGAAAIATQLAFQLEGVKVDELSAKLQKLVIDLAAAQQKQKELADAGGLQAIGFSPATAASMASTLATQDEMNKKVDQGTDALKRWNTQAETAYARNLELVKQTAIDTKDYFSFLAASFEQGATAGHSMFEDLDTLAKNTASNMRTAFSDIFFATLQGNMKDAQAAFKNFFLSILREITNLMASQAVKGFLGLFGINVKGGQLDFSGLFGGGSQPGGIGTSDRTRPIGTGGLDPMGEGVIGGDPFSAVQMGQAATSLLAAGKSLQGSATVWNAITSGWSAGEGLFGGIAGAASQGFDAMSKAFTGMTAVVGYAAAVIQGVLTIMDNTKSNLGKAIQTATLAAGIAAAPWTAGLSLIAAGVINWIEDLFGLFKKGISSYAQKRITAVDQATEGLTTLGKMYERAAATGDPSKFLGALQTRTEGSAGPGRGASTILLATPELAAQLGLRIDPRNMQEGKFEVSWSDVTQAQFDELLRLLAKNEGAIPGIVGGRVDVGYLPQENVSEAERNAAAIGEAMIKSFVAFQRVRQEITKLTDDIQDAVKDFLPADLAVNFKTNLLDPIRDQIIAAVSSGLSIDAITAKLDTLKATLSAYVNLVGLYGQLTQDFAMYSGDFTRSLAYVNEQMQNAREAAAKKIVVAAKDVGLGPELVDPVSAKLLDVDDAIHKIQLAFANMNLTPVEAFDRLAALRDAVIERFELEKKLVLEAEAGINKLYTEHVTGILEFQRSLEEVGIAMTGSDAGINAMIQRLLALGTTSLSVSESLYTVSAALKIFIESLPARIAGKGGRPDDPSRGAGALPVDQILDATLGVVMPFAATLNREIRNAFDAGDFESAFNLLNQLGAGLKAAMDAAIAGVRQWEQAQISAINNEADNRIKEATRIRDMYQKQLDAERDVIEGWLQSIELQKNAIQDQKWAIEDLAYGVRLAMRPLEDALEDITHQQEALRRTMRPINAEIASIEDLLRPLENQIKGITRQQEALQRAMRPLDTEIAHIEDLMRPLEDALKGITRQQEALRRAMRPLDAEIARIEDMLRPLENQIKGITRQQEALQRSMRPLDLVLASLEDSIEGITRQQDQLQRSMRPINAEIASIEGLLRPLQQQITALDRNAELSQRVADDLLWTIELQQRALEKQRDTIQDEIDLIEEMANAVLSVRGYLYDLALSQQAPPDALGQFQLAKTSFDQLFTSFTTAPDAQGLGKLQDAAQDLLATLEPLFARPSAEYRELYESIVQKLQQASDLGSNLGDPASLDDLKDQLASVDTQLDTLNTTAEAIRDGLSLYLHSVELLKRPLEDNLLLGQQYIDSLNDQKALIQHQIDLLEEQKQPVQDTIDAINAQKKLIQRQIDLLEEQKQPIQDQLDLGQEYINSINDQKALIQRQIDLLEEQKWPIQDQIDLAQEYILSLNDQKALIQRQIDLLEEQKWPIQDQIDLAQEYILSLNDQKALIQRQIDLLEDQKQPVQDQLDIMQGWLDGFDDQLEVLGRQEEILGRQETILNRDLSRIALAQEKLNKAYEDEVDAINTDREKAIAAISKAADDIVKSIEEAMMPLMKANALDSQHFYEWMRNEQYARLMELTSGQGTAAWMRTAQQNTAAWIGAIMNALVGFLSGDMKTVVAAVQDQSVEERMIAVLTNLDGSVGNLNSSIGGLNTYLAGQGVAVGGGGGPASPPESPGGGFAEGLRYVHTGTYPLHEGEMVVPQAQAIALRAASDSWAGLSQLANGGGGNMYITIAPVIHSNQNPAVIVNQVVDRIVVDIRGGGAIQDAIARMPKRSR